MTGHLVVPALAFRQYDRIDAAATHHYAAALTGTVATHIVISGSVANGNTLSIDERTNTLDIWLCHVPASRLVACCWTSEDVDEATSRGVTPLVVLRECGSESDVVNAVTSLAEGSFIYSHPRYSTATLDAAAISAARVRAHPLAGAKVSKASYEHLYDLRQASGPHTVLWHGSSRNISASSAAGASGVVSTALAAVPPEFEEQGADRLQPVIDRIQVMLDNQPTHRARIQLLTTLWQRRAGVHVA